eukprot:scaffold75760_cov60-Cyclotella_meneghiniana.AAC.5
MGHVTTKYYLNATSLMPIISVKYGQSIFFYYLNRDDNKYYTRLYFYRPDDRVQIFSQRLGWYPPFRGALPINYNGSNHFQAVKIHPDFDEYSPRPTLAGGEDESVVYNMTQFDTGDMSDAEAMTDGDDTVVTRFSKTTEATDDTDSIASRFSLAEHIQTNVDINEISANATSNYDSQKMIVLDSTPIVSNTTAPDRESSLPNASSLADQLEDEAKPKSSNAHNIASSDAHGDPSVHKFNMPSPLQNAIAGTKSKESNPLFDGRERVDNVTVLANFTNKAEQHISVKREVFDQLISCTWDDDVIGWKLTGLSWGEVKYRAGTIFKELSKYQPFKSHYDPRSKGGA